MHICLKFLGNITEADVDKIKQKMDALQGKGAFSFDLSGVGAFPDMNLMRVIWAGVKDSEGKEKMIELQKMLDDSLEDIGFNKENREFTAHLTLGRVRKKPNAVLKGLVERYNEESFGTVNVKEIRLMKSELRSFGPRYWVLHSVEL